MKTVIVDYGMGNLKSLMGALSFLGCKDLEASASEEVISRAHKVILPGVGSFPAAIKNIDKLNLREVLLDVAAAEDKYIMGICLGMQLLCRSSDEEGIITDGLGIVDADVRRFSSGAIVPHMGYNQVSSLDAGRLYEGIDDHSDFYFVHSHRVESCAEGLAGLCDYDQGFVASYEVNGVFGVQFHPELSQGPGLKLISNFLKLV